MKPLHILTADETAAVVCHELARRGQTATWGTIADPAAKYLIEPRAPAGRAQADRLAADQILCAVRNTHDGDLSEYRAAAFTVCVRRPAGPCAVAQLPAAAQSSVLISPAAQKIIQIDITDACPRACSNCTRLCGHSAVRYSMDPAQFRAAVDSLAGYEGMVGVMGGEPTIHPAFAELTHYLDSRRPDPPPGAAQYVPGDDWVSGRRAAMHWQPWRKGLWTGLGPGYRQHYELIQRVYRYQCVNDHRGGMRHLALLLPRRDLGIPDAEWLRYRDACWLQHQWSASVTPRGAYFCEVAAALARLFGGPDGWPIEPGWWQRSAGDFGAQLELCEYCSACLPVPSRTDADGCDQVTHRMAKRLQAAGSRKPLEIVTATWAELKARYRPAAGAEPYAATGDRQRVHAPTGLEVGPVTAVTVCRDCDDYLALTLPRMLATFARVIVVTSPGDTVTQRLAASLGAVTHVTATLAPPHFRKGAAIAEALGALPAAAWVAVLDADIILPAAFRDRLAGLILNPGALYYAERIGPPLADWSAAPVAARLALAADDWTALRETYGSGLYSQRSPWGYLQIFNLSAAALVRRPARYPGASLTAADDDYILAHDWYGPERCIELSGLTVVHLPHGTSRRNWYGRVSPRLDDDAWWISDNSLRWRISYRAGCQLTGLWDLLRAVKLPPDSCIVEIGTMLGDAALVMAMAYPDVRIITVDPGPNPACQAEARYRLANRPNITRWEMPSLEAASRAWSDSLYVGLVYIDGDHSAEGVGADIAAWRRLLHRGGCLAGHDYAVPAWPGVQQAVDAAFGRPDAVYADSSWLIREPSAAHPPPRTNPAKVT